jgi:ATP-binding cassette subfamily B multidrug efflux pump
MSLPAMFRLFETALNPTEPPAQSQPPAGLVAFYWHFARQAKELFAALFVAGLIVALLDSTIPVFMGRIVTLVTSSKPETLWTEQWPMLVGMAVVLLLFRPLAMMAQNLVANQAIAVNVANMIRWQNHFHVARQSWAFFQNDFAGRIANRVMQTGPAVRESLVALITGVWYILVYGTAALFLLASADRWLALPIVIWFVGYLVMLRVFVPRMRDRSKAVSEARSWLVGRIVDTYTNILTVKLFARARDEDAYVREAFEEHTGLFYNSLRLNTLFSFCLSTLNAALVTGTGAMAIYLWVHGKVEVGTVAMALPLSWQIISIAGWVAMRVTEIFENIGVVQEGMQSIAVPHSGADHADGPGGCRHACRAARRDRIPGHPFRLRPRERTDRRAVAHHPPRRAHRLDRPIRRGKIDAGQSDAALLRSGGRPHPDRRPGHFARHAGEPAHADFGGDAGHFAVAPHDPRQYPLRQA